MRDGSPEVVHLPDTVIVDELFLELLGVQGVGDGAEMYGRRAVVRGVSTDVRTLTASPFIFTSIESARKYDKRYGPDEITYVLVRCSPGYTAEEVRDRLRAELSHVEVLTGREFAIRTMKYWMLETGLGITVVLTALLGLTVSVVVTSQTLFTVTQEHLGYYAMLSAVGFGRTQLLLSVIMQGVVLASGGVLIGSTMFMFAAYFSSRTPLPLETLPELYAGLVAMSAASSIAGAFLSMRSVLKLDPATVFRA
jgi:putative ABC transport system permease protein